MKKIIGIIVFLLAWAGVQADVLTDITSGKFKAKAPEEMTPLADGERYAQLRGNDLFAYSYKTGQVTDTLFEYARAKGNKPAKIEGYVLSPCAGVRQQREDIPSFVSCGLLYLRPQTS